MRPRTSEERRAIDGAEALLSRDIEQCWRNWQAFIAEQQDALAAQQAEDAPEADLTGSGRTAPRTARLDAATRQQFGAVLEARRQQAQAQAEQTARQHATALPDADQVYATLLAHIAAELGGVIHPSGKALVWYKDALIKFDAAAVSAGTTAADYLSAGAGGGSSKRQALLVLAVAVVLLGVLVVMWQWAFGPGTTETAQTVGTARVGQQNAPLWTVEAAAVGGVAVPATLRGGYPAVLCVGSAAAQPGVPGTTVVLSGTQAIRRYQVQAAGASALQPADLLLADCSATPPTTKASAQLIETRTRTPLDHAVLRAVTVRGPDLDPQAIPAGQMEVALAVALPDAGAGTLILADGQRWAATRSAAVAGGTQLLYLVPLAESAQAAGWELPQGSTLPGLLVLNLPAPTRRAALLRRVLHVQAGVPTIGQRDGEPELVLTLTLTLAADAAPLTLLLTDLEVQSDGVPLDARWDAPQLTPGIPKTLPLRVALRERAAIELALANWRARLTTE